MIVYNMPNDIEPIHRVTVKFIDFLNSKFGFPKHDLTERVLDDFREAYVSTEKISTALDSLAV